MFPKFGAMTFRLLFITGRERNVVALTKRANNIASDWRRAMRHRQNSTPNRKDSEKMKKIFSKNGATTFRLLTDDRCSI